MTPSSTLPAGAHTYDSILSGVRVGRYHFARVRTASGRLSMLIGISSRQLAAMEREARRHGLGLAFIGSRVSGPRARQRELHPVLLAALPLYSTKRTATSNYAGVEGVRIEKTAIKEFGGESIHTSDLTVFLVDPEGRSPERLQALAELIERRFMGLGCSFPIKVFPGYGGRSFGSEQDIERFGADYLQRCLPEDHGFTRLDLESAYRELFMTLNLPRSRFVRADVLNGLWNASLTTASFSIALGFHPVIPVVGFLFGLCGRYLARFKTWVTRDPADTVLTNSLALAADAAIGITVMACVIDPMAGLGIPLKRIVWASLLHTLSKGSLRLFLDKHFSKGALGSQKLGVFLVTTVNFLQGLTTAFIYSGSRTAVVLQAGMAVLGLALVYTNPLSRAHRAKGLL